MKRFLPKLFWVCLSLLATEPLVRAQVTREEAVPHTVWLDFNRLASQRWPSAELPAWLESVSASERKDENGLRVATVFRIRLIDLPQLRLRVAPLNKEMQLRLFFEDRPEAAPTVSGYSETGNANFQSRPLGQGLGLPTSEAVIFSSAGTHLVEIEVPGDGSNVRGVFLAELKTSELRRVLDFNPPIEIIDAFGQAPPLKPGGEDLALYGRVKATLDGGVMKLSPEDATFGVWEFDLRTVPLLALVTFEVLNTDSEAPLQVWMNDRPLGAPDVQWPDLADPGYLGLVRPLEPGMRFRYSGWLRVQKMIPGSALQVGANRLTLQLSADSGPIAVRAVELQLKHNWKNLDYQVAPAAP